MFRLITTMTALLLLSGCATVIKGTTQTMPINSDPDGADVVVNNLVLGRSAIGEDPKQRGVCGG